MRHLSHVSGGRHIVAKPSDSELKLLRELWRAKRLSARELHDATAAATRWSYSTTRKTLDRLVEKGLARVEMVHGLKTYAARAAKLEILAGLVNDFARNVLDLDGPIPAATFAQSKVIAADEIETLEQLLAELSADEEGQA